MVDIALIDFLSVGECRDWPSRCVGHYVCIELNGKETIACTRWSQMHFIAAGFDEDQLRRCCENVTLLHKVTQMRLHTQSAFPCSIM